jgi:DNA ligase-1
LGIQLVEVVRTWAEVRATRMRRVKSRTLGRCLAEAGDDLPIIASWLSGVMRQGRIGVGYSMLSEVRDAAGPPPDAPEWSVADVDDAFTRIANESGTGSKQRRFDAVLELFQKSTAPERLFLLELLSGELRQGAQEGVLLDAIATAADLPLSAVRRAFMLTGEIPLVAQTALEEGEAGLARFCIEVFRPLRPMLASPADTAAAAMVLMDEDAFVDCKLDGVRVQLHRDGDRVKVFTRHLHDVTGMVPEVAQVARELPWERFVLDAEAIGLHEDGTPLPFQVTMRRFGRRVDVGRMRFALPLTTVVFDALLLGDAETIDWPAHERFAELERIPRAHRVYRKRIKTVEQAEAFYEEVVEAGHEGIMVKSPTSTYQAGARGRSWLKVKPTHTLDLVVLAAEWGSGRRTGWLSNLHLGARDETTGEFVMLGKTFKGLTDDLLEWQTAALQKIEVDRNEYQVFVRPEIVVEIAFNDVQASSQYPGGVALRFARVKRYRKDKKPEEADTLATVRALLPDSLAESAENG